MLRETRVEGPDKRPTPPRAPRPEPKRWVSIGFTADVWRRLDAAADVRAQKTGVRPGLSLLVGEILDAVLPAAISPGRRTLSRLSDPGRTDPGDTTGVD